VDGKRKQGIKKVIADSFTLEFIEKASGVKIFDGG
jgi:hypothetical protein